MNTGLNWYEAEVVKVYLDDKKIIKDVGKYPLKDRQGNLITPQKANHSHYNTIRVHIPKIDGKYSNDNSRVVRPLDPHLIFMPLVGESVICTEINGSWYFLMGAENLGTPNNDIRKNRSRSKRFRNLDRLCPNCFQSTKYTRL